ncbi:hypothetical protein AYI68_g158 [Smittium mucronatum]|uniref:Uncharacterized protein n=1 Tax=Smittium mucronatum TaxID=133383 RepID=A0A1R0H912_9FUNG|nr:hypothetical protein AYI68_g158 [Smittium mucronatum]
MGIKSIFRRQKSRAMVGTVQISNSESEFSVTESVRRKTLKDTSKANTKNKKGPTDILSSSEAVGYEKISNSKKPFIRLGDGFSSESSLPDFSLGARLEHKNDSGTGFRSKLDPKGGYGDFEEVFNVNKNIKDESWRQITGKGSQESSNLSSTETSVYQHFDNRKDTSSSETHGGKGLIDDNFHSKIRAHKSFHYFDAYDGSDPNTTSESIFNYSNGAEKSPKISNDLLNSEFYFDSSIIDWDNKGISEIYRENDKTDSPRLKMETFEDFSDIKVSYSDKKDTKKGISPKSDLVEKTSRDEIVSSADYLKNAPVNRNTEIMSNKNGDHEERTIKNSRKKSFIFGLVRKKTSDKHKAFIENTERKTPNNPIHSASKNTDEAENISQSNDNSDDESLPLDMRKNKKFSEELKKLAEEEEVRLAKELERVKMIKKKENEEKRRNKVYDRMRERHLREYKINNAGELYKPAYPTLQDDNNSAELDASIINQRNNYINSRLDTPMNYPLTSPNNVFPANGIAQEDYSSHLAGGKVSQLMNVQYETSHSDSTDSNGRELLAESDDIDQNHGNQGMYLSKENNDDYHSGCSSDSDESLFTLNKKILKKIAQKERKYISSGNLSGMSSKLKELKKLKDQISKLESSLKNEYSSQGCPKTRYIYGESEPKTGYTDLSLNRKKVRFNHTVSVVFESPLTPCYPNVRSSYYGSYSHSDIFKSLDDLDLYMKKLKDEKPYQVIRNSQSLVDINSLSELGKKQLRKKVSEMSIIAKQFSDIKNTQENFTLSPELNMLKKNKCENVFEEAEPITRTTIMANNPNASLEIPLTEESVPVDHLVKKRGKRVERIPLKHNEVDCNLDESRKTSNDALIGKNEVEKKEILTETHHGSLKIKNNIENSTNSENISINPNALRRDQDVASQFNLGYTGMHHVQGGLPNQIYNHQHNYIATPQISSRTLKTKSFQPNNIATPNVFYNSLYPSQAQNKTYMRQSYTPSMVNMNSASQQNLTLSNNNGMVMSAELNQTLLNSQHLGRTLGSKSIRNSMSIPTFSRIIAPQTQNTGPQFQQSMYQNVQTPKFQQMQLAFQQMQLSNQNNISFSPVFLPGGVSYNSQGQGMLINPGYNHGDITTNNLKVGVSAPQYNNMTVRKR